MSGGRVQKKFQIGMWRDELPVWWYAFHNLIFILYDDKILLFILMCGRRQIKPWDLEIIWNGKFPKGEAKFGSLQRRQWDPGILLSYLNQVDSLVKRSGHQRNDYDQIGAAETWWKHFAVLYDAYT